jgi:hypothetical protein
MCRRSRAAARTGTGRQQPLEGIDPGGMSVTPVNPDSVGSHQCHRRGTDVGRDRERIEQWPAAHLLDATGARTSEAKGAGREEPLVAALIPLDTETVIGSVDCVWYGVHDGYWLWTIGKTKKPSRQSEGFLDTASGQQPIANSLLRHQILQSLPGLALTQAEQGTIP